MKKYTAWLLVLVLLVTFPTVALGSLFDMTEEEVEASMTQYYKGYLEMGLIPGANKKAMQRIFPFKDRAFQSITDTSVLASLAAREDGNFFLLLNKDSTTGKIRDAMTGFFLFNEKDVAFIETAGMFSSILSTLYASEGYDAALNKGYDMFLSISQQPVDDASFQITDPDYALSFQKLGDFGVVLTIAPADDAMSAPNASGL